jgi:hypothetical protein
MILKSKAFWAGWLFSTIILSLLKDKTIQDVLLRFIAGGAFAIIVVSIIDFIIVLFTRKKDDNQDYPWQ